MPGHHEDHSIEPIKWAIVGPGSIAKQFTRDLQWSNYLHEVVAVVGHEPGGSTKDFAREFNIKHIYTDIAALLEDGHADIIYVATPHSLHYDVVLTCLENSMPVLCEKPLVLNAEQCEQLIAAATNNNVFLMEGMWLRFLPSIQQVLQLIQEGRIGKIISLKAAISYRAPADDNSRYFDPEKGGGSLLDLGVYPVFLSLLLLGEPSLIKAIGKLTDQGVDESACMLFQYPDGAYSILESSLVTEMHVPAEITGEKGVIRILDPWYEKASGIELDLFDEGTIVYPSTWEGHGLYFEVDEVVERMRENKISSDQMSHQFSLSILKVMDEIRQQVDVSYEKYE